MDFEKAGPLIYPTLADGSIVVVRRDNDSPPRPAETLGLWCAEGRRDVRGYVVRPLGESDVLFAEFDDLGMP